jgi:hypothetical protein
MGSPACSIRNRAEISCGDHQASSHSVTWAASRGHASFGIFRSEASFLPVLQLQRADAEALAADAAGRGWGEEAARHRRLIARLDLLIAQAHAS